MADATGVCYTQSGNVKRYESTLGPSFDTNTIGAIITRTNSGGNTYEYKVTASGYNISTSGTKVVVKYGPSSAEAKKEFWFDVSDIKIKFTIIFKNGIGSNPIGDAAYWMDITVGKHNCRVYHNEQSGYGVYDRNHWDNIELDTISDYKWTYNGDDTTTSFTIGIPKNEFVNSNTININVTEGHECENTDNTANDYYLNRVIKIVLNGQYQIDKGQDSKPYLTNTQLYIEQRTCIIENDIENISIDKTFYPDRYSSGTTEFNDTDVSFSNNSNKDDYFFESTYINYVDPISTYISLLKKSVLLYGLSFYLDCQWIISGVHTNYNQQIIYGNQYNSKVGCIPLYTDKDYFDYLSSFQFNAMPESIYGDVSAMKGTITGEFLNKNVKYVLVDDKANKVNANISFKMNMYCTATGNSPLDTFNVIFQNGLSVSAT